uniref:MATH domain-containing protein n=1 Tax=Chenopodium quinoa TaxID=63459 RepID=A0A803LPV1_CHEQI
MRCNIKVTCNAGNYSFEFTDPSKPVRTFRTRRPCHFIFEIDNYKQLVESMEIANLKYFETPDFTVGDEKWSMCIYPNGNKERQGSDYVSLYLKRLKSAGRSKEANASMKFFILEQNSDEYLVIEDLGEKHFDVRGRKWGIAQAIALDDFTDKDNGFLVDNTCTFGAEVFITSAEPSYSKMSLVNSISNYFFKIVDESSFL